MQKEEREGNKKREKRKEKREERIREEEKREKKDLVYTGIALLPVVDSIKSHTFLIRADVASSSIMCFKLSFAVLESEEEEFTCW